MTPVCPACRAPIRVDAHVCGRCGLAVRPTCSNCAEPLMHGMRSCWFCHEPVEEAVDVATVPIVRPAHHDTSVAAPPVQEAAAPHVSVPVFRPRHHRSSGGALLVWLLFAVVLTLVLLAVEIAMPRFPSIAPASLELQIRAFPEFGFSIGYPAEWIVEEKKDHVSFTARELIGKLPTRGLRAKRSELDFRKVDDSVRRINRERVRGYRTIDATEDLLDGRDALVFVFAGNDLRFEQWWVDRGKRTLLLEFWSRQADDGAAEVNKRIARSLKVL